MISEPSGRQEYSIEFAAHETVKTAIVTIAKQAWRAAVGSNGRPRDGAQLRLTDHDGWRITCLATNACDTGWRLAELDVRLGEPADTAPAIVLFRNANS